MRKPILIRGWIVVVILLAAAGFAPASTQPVAAQTPAAQTPADAGNIAYVKASTGDIHVIAPGGSGDRLLWTNTGLGVMKIVRELAWRPDGRELAFTSEHEAACSWYDSDVYAIDYNGRGYRRITNSPACAALAGLSKGAVTVNVNNGTSNMIWVYVQGAPSVESVSGGFYGTVTFNDVADLGPGVYQPSIGIGGLDRFTSYPPYADVQAGQTVPGGTLTIMSASGFRGFGAGKVSWKADGSALAYGMRTGTAITQIAASPSYGQTGANLPVVERAKPALVAWGPAPAAMDEYLYSSGMNVLVDNSAGIYRNSVGDASGGEQLVRINDYSGEYLHDIEWLPDGSGFLFSLFYPGMGFFSDIFEYNFATQTITQLTPTLNDESEDGGARALSISPDGGQIVFERAVYPLDTASSLWIINRDGSGLHKLVDDGGRPAWGRTPSFPTPTITGLDPAGVAAGGPAFTLTVNGADFVSGSVVRWNGSDRPTAYVDSTRLTAAITAADIAAVGSANVTVFNGGPGGGASNAAAFDIVELKHQICLPAIRR